MRQPAFLSLRARRLLLVLLPCLASRALAACTLPSQRRAGLDCAVDDLAHELFVDFLDATRALGGGAGAPANRSAAALAPAARLGALELSALTELLGGALASVEVRAPGNASRGRRRPVPWRGGGRPLAPGKEAGIWRARAASGEDGSKAEDGALWTGMHLAREQDAQYYNAYRQLCATMRKIIEVLIVPEGFIGIAFGFWWMNMMTMKTCYICNLGLVPKDTGPSCSAKG